MVRWNEEDVVEIEQTCAVSVRYLPIYTPDD